MKRVKIGGFETGGGKLLVIAGPCVIESEEQTIEAAKAVKNVLDGLPIDLVFKTSYDKANRSSLASYRGPGIDAGLEILAKVKKETGLAVLTDVHTAAEARKAAAVADAIQIPAFLSRQTELLLAAGSAAVKEGVCVNIKKGQFLPPDQIGNAIDKVISTGAANVFVTERGTTFGHGDLVVDVRSVPIMRSFGYPVVIDATHSVQKPGGLGHATGGEREFVPVIARAGVAAGADGVFLEVHPSPDDAPCDGPNMLPVAGLRPLIAACCALYETVRTQPDVAGA